MRLLFSSFHDRLVDQIGAKLAEAGVPCEIRYRPLGNEAPDCRYREVWIQADNEIQWASNLVAMHCSVGLN